MYRCSIETYTRDVYKRQALQHIKDVQHIPVYSMGSHTTKALQSYGFHHCITLPYADLRLFGAAILKEEQQQDVYKRQTQAVQKKDIRSITKEAVLMLERSIELLKERELS